MLYLIIILALLPAAIGTVIWITLAAWTGIAWVFMAPFRLAGWLIRTVRGVLS